jgi:SH3 domain protein
MNNKKFLSGVLLAGMLSLSGAAFGETGYVTDMLQLDLYATEAMDGRPLRKLRSGDSFELLEQKRRYAKVRLPGGQTGWVKSLYIVTKEPARTRLNKIEKRNASLEAQLEETGAQLAERAARVAELEGNRSGAEEQLELARSELDELREQNATLRGTLQSYGSSVPTSWLIIVSLLMLGLGCFGGWYYIDSRSRARHGGYRVY